jgi:dTDP-4-amino-4,6-dideoxygalactose transaminase
MLSIGVREVAAAVGVLVRGNLSRFQSGQTSRTSVFERRLQDTIGVKHALAVNSGTSALVCALVGAGVGPGDEVLVPAYTWVATAAAPLAVGAVPVLVDIDESLSIDPIDIKRKITPYTKAIIPVHMRNLVADMDSLMQIARDHDLVVIEDASQAIGVKYRGRRVGSIGHAGAFSFNQHKNIKSGEGGALLTNDMRIFARAGMYHDVGSYSREDRFQANEPLFVGLNLRMPELSAAILDPQLKRIDKQLAKRQARRQMIVEELSRNRELRISPHNDPSNAVGITVVFDKADAAARFAKNRGINRLIDTGRHIYTNWQSILEKRSFHPRMDPYAWSHGSVDPAKAHCPVTLDILERTCSVSVDPEVPILVLRHFIRRAISAF